MSLPSKSEFTLEELMAMDREAPVETLPAAEPSPVPAPAAPQEYTLDELRAIEDANKPQEFTPEELSFMAVETLDDPDYVPTRDEYFALKAEKDRLRERGLLPSGWDIAKDAVGGLIVTASDAIGHALAHPVDSLARSAATLQTGVGRAAVNTLELGSWAKRAMEGEPSFRVEQTGEFLFKHQTRNPIVFEKLKERGLTARPVTGEDLKDFEFDNFLFSKGIKSQHKALGEQTAPTELVTSIITGRRQDETPVEAQAAAVEIVTDPINYIPFGAGVKTFNAGRGMKLASAKGADILGKAAGAVADVPDNLLERFSRAITKGTGATAQEQARLLRNPVAATAIAGGGSTSLALIAEQAGALPEGTTKNVALAAGAYALGYGVLRTVQKTANTTAVILRESADATNGLDIAARAAVSSNPAVPSIYREVLERPTAFVPIESTPQRLANDPRLGRFAQAGMRALSNPVAVQGVRTASAVVGGAVKGRIANEPFAMLAENAGEEDAAAAMRGTGAALGAAGGLTSRFSGLQDRRRQAEISDVARMLVDVELAGGNVARLFETRSQNDLARLAAMQGFFRDRVDFIPLSGKPTPDGKPSEFEVNAEASGASGAAGRFMDAKPGQKARIFINLDSDRPLPEFHEFGHALIAGGGLDSGQQQAVRAFVQQRYGTDGIQARGQEYATNMILAEKRAADPSKPATATPEEIAIRMDELDQRSLATGNQTPLDWARDEIFAEEFARGSAEMDFARVRRNLPAGFSPVTLMEGVLGAQARALQASGVRIDPQTGAPLDTPASIFNNNPLLATDKTLLRQLETYSKNYRSWIDNPEQTKPRGVPVAPRGRPADFADNPNVTFRDNGTGVLETEFARRNPQTGQVEFKPQAEIDAFHKKRAQQVLEMAGSRLLPDGDPNVGPRRSKTSGKVEIVGKQLPDRFYQLNGFAPHIRDFARQMQQASDNGEPILVRYHALLSRSDTGAIRVKDLGNLEAVSREVVPYSWKVSSKGNLLAGVIDLTTFRARAMRAINKGDENLRIHFGNDMGKIETGLRTLMENWKNDLPGDSGLGTPRKNILNALLGIDTKLNRRPDVNPVSGSFGSGTVVKTFRLDRVDAITPTGRSGFHFDYSKANQNLLPEVASPRPDLTTDLK